VHFGAPSFVELRDMIFPFYASLSAGWSDGEKARFKDEMLNSVQEMAKDIIVRDGENGNTRKVGLIMTAIVVAAQK
jgi:hypothetical protein